MRIDSHLKIWTSQLIFKSEFFQSKKKTLNWEIGQLINGSWLFLDDDEDISAPMEGDDDEDVEGKGDVPEKEIKEETNEEGEIEKETPMEQQAEEDDVDPLDAYMEEVKQEVKKFNMGAMKGNDKVSAGGDCDENYTNYCTN